MSKASVVLPEPDRPVTTVKASRGNRQADVLEVVLAGVADLDAGAGR